MDEDSWEGKWTLMDSNWQPTCRISTHFHIPYIACPLSFSDGILWPPTDEGMTANVPCTMASSKFRCAVCQLTINVCHAINTPLHDVSSSLLQVRRFCDNGVWSSVDFSGCTLASANTEPFLLIWYETNDQQTSLQQVEGLETAIVSEV